MKILYQGKKKSDAGVLSKVMHRFRVFKEPLVPDSENH
jgi:hypothetical protein